MAATQNVGLLGSPRQNLHGDSKLGNYPTADDAADSTNRPHDPCAASADGRDTYLIMPVAIAVSTCGGRGQAPRRFWQWTFYYPSVSTNAAVRDGNWKLVRPMIAGTRYYQNPDLYVSDEDAVRTAAFIEADMKHKENPAAITELVVLEARTVGMQYGTMNG